MARAAAAMIVQCRLRQMLEVCHAVTSWRSLQRAAANQNTTLCMVQEKVAVSSWLAAVALIRTLKGRNAVLAPVLACLLMCT